MDFKSEIHFTRIILLLVIATFMLTIFTYSEYKKSQSFKSDGMQTVAKIHKKIDSKKGRNGLTSCYIGYNYKVNNEFYTGEGTLSFPCKLASNIVAIIYLDKTPNKSVTKNHKFNFNVFLFLTTCLLLCIILSFSCHYKSKVTGYIFIISLNLKIGEIAYLANSVNIQKFISTGFYNPTLLNIAYSLLIPLSIIWTIKTIKIIINKEIVI